MREFVGLDLFGVDIVFGPDGPIIVDINDFPSFRRLTDALDILANACLSLIWNRPRRGHIDFARHATPRRSAASLISASTRPRKTPQCRTPPSTPNNPSLVIPGPRTAHSKVNPIRPVHPAVPAFPGSLMTDDRSTWHDEFPDLYARLTPDQQAALNNTLGSHALDGMHPDRDVVSDLVDFITGVIDQAEYDRRSEKWAASSGHTS